MSNIVISVENLSKSYRLGQIGTGTISRDLEVWWAKLRGKPNPLLRIGEKDHNERNGEIFWALKDVSFQVAQGDVLGIIGRNGAGKSTLLKILSRVTAPTSGLVKVKGRIASLLEVGTGFHPELTGRENIFLNGAILGMSNDEVKRKLDEIVAFAEIENFLDTPVKRYSSGMYVRLAFAVAAHLNSELLIVDEVLAVGDAEFQKKCLGKMGDVAKTGRTVLFVSHNLSAIQRLCTSASLLDKGELINWGSVHPILDQYASQFSKAVGSRFDLYNLPMPSWQRRQWGDLSFSKCALINMQGNHESSFKFGESIRIDLELVSKKRFENLDIGAGINTSNDERIATIRTPDYGVNFTIFPDEPLRINILLKNFYLLPGHYFLMIFAHSSGYSSDVIHQVISFEVQESAIPNFIPVKFPEGFIRSDAEWIKVPSDNQI